MNGVIKSITANLSFGEASKSDTARLVIENCDFDFNKIFNSFPF